ncbi:DUF4391 domain-containing protein [Bifidobacterium gallicum]|uniref:Tmp1 n=1 Tax=Bifidobacterium gallicum DSM 20093 = LMG 11596 TaxID=561180 RepID=D1NTE3_9BIFI|nr:DUF4391 domain-containing protein [Bifidobacterium gallicum]EFA22997.1 hypothetical protein BIFGAL_03100 [Bifidobacterium gallicum DSM 20093 = LMG 11596]KFI57686.1 tmp1 [Bifidobacterium gallicum DSM 20093 = LMG 11596]
MTQEFSTCGSLTITDLGLPAAAAAPEQKGRLPKAMFAGKNPAELPKRVYQQLAQHVASIHLLGILTDRTANTQPVPHVPEVLVLGLKLAADIDHIPDGVIELIASQRKGGIVFACVREVDTDSPAPAASAASDPTASPEPLAPGEYVSYAVRRGFSAHAGHTPTYEVFATDWMPVEDPLQLAPQGETMAQLWDNLCAQIMLGQDTTDNLHADLLRLRRKTQLQAELAKVTADHARAKTTDKRNALFTKKAQLTRELEQLG